MWGINYFGASFFGENWWGFSTVAPPAGPDYFGVDYFGENYFGNYWQSSDVLPGPGFVTYVDPRAAYIAYEAPDPRDCHVLNPTPEGNIWGVDPRKAIIVK